MFSETKKRAETMNTFFSCDTSGCSRQRGGLLVTALILMAVMAIALTSYLSLGRATLRVANRNFYVNGAVDLAETGIEQAMWAINTASTGDSTAWDGWAKSGSIAQRSFSNFNYSGGVAGSVNVYVENYNGSGAVVTAKSNIVLNDGKVIEKWIQVKLKGRSLFEYGLLARDKISAEGGCVFDSWVSDPDSNPLTPSIPYSNAVAKSNGSIAAGATGSSSVTLKPSAKVYGKVSVGTASGPTITYGSLGAWPITPGVNAAAGLKQDWGTVVGPKGSPDTYLQQDYLVTDFSAAFQQISAPAGATVVASYTLPYSYDDPATSWNDNIYVANATLGTAGTTRVIQMNKLSVLASAKLTIQGDVTLILPPSGTNTFEVIQGGSVTLGAGAKLKIYTPGNIAITGGGSAGVINNSTPDALQIWSTRPTGSMGQTISLQGSGSLQAIIYAPDATFSAPGGTNFSGSAIVYSAVLQGSGSVHYDESLRSFSANGSGSSVQIESYMELNTPGQRQPYLALLNF
jgi:hypothetical protein